MCGTATPCLVDNPSRPEKMRVKTKTKRVAHKHPKPNNWKRESQLLEPANTCPCFCIVWIGVIASNLRFILARSPRTWLAPYPLRAFLASWGKSDTELDRGWRCKDGVLLLRFKWWWYEAIRVCARSCLGNDAVDCLPSTSCKKSHYLSLHLNCLLHDLNYR
jgi:hypothetical protein